jgi:hypothetical protein
VKTKSLIQTCKGVCAILVVYWWYTGGIPPVYHKRLYRFGSGILFSHGGAMKLLSISVSRLLCIALHCTALHCLALHCIVQSEAHFNLKLTALRSMRVQWIFFFLCLVWRLLCIALHCIALRCIALHCSVWSAFQFKADSTEIYESSMNLFLLVFSLKCISIKTRQHWDLREFCFCFSACNAFQFVTTVCTS